MYCTEIAFHNVPASSQQQAVYSFSATNTTYVLKYASLTHLRREIASCRRRTVTVCSSPLTHTTHTTDFVTSKGTYLKIIYLCNWAHIYNEILSEWEVVESWKRSNFKGLEIKSFGKSIIFLNYYALESC